MKIAIIFKYILGIVLAIFLLPYYWIMHNKSFNKYQQIALILICLILSLTNVVQSVLGIVLSYLGVYEGYIYFGSPDGQAMDARFFFELIIWFIVICYRRYTFNFKLFQ